MSEKYPGGFVTLNPPVQDPALGAATPGIWTLDQALNAEVTRSWPMYDPYYKNVVLNLHGNGTNGAQNNTFVDSSTNNFTITRNGNTTQGTFSPYGSLWSNNFGSANFFSSASNAAFAFGTGDFTVEAWVFPTSAYGTYNYVFGVAVTGGLVFYVANGYLTLRAYNVSDILTSSSAPALNTWSHVAVTRSGTTVTIYINGVSVGSTTSSYNFAQGAAYAGNDSTNAAPWYGYMSNLRVVKGTAVYTSNFTPSTTPLTAVIGTSWLVCQSNRFIDNSSNAFAITTSGSPSVQRFSPFNQNLSYTPQTIGGSGYFDGTGDYLSIADNVALQFGTGSLTVEAWIKTSVKTDYQNIVGSYSSDAWYLHTNAAGTITWGLTAGAPQTGTKQVCDNAWHHIAIVRNGSSSTTLYVDGVADGTASISANINYGAAVRIGSLAAGTERYLTGYIADVRLNKGTAVYTSAFTPPTAPLTAISGTSLLTSMTNAGIPDSAMMNDLETVGNAQVSTSVKKYGTGSLAFDGSGDYLAAPNKIINALDSGAFTMELWIYRLGNGSGGAGVYDAIFGSNTGATSIYGLYVKRSDGTLGFYTSAGLVTTSNSLSNNSWTHIAVCRDSSNTLKIFINGVSGYSGSYTGTGALVNPFYIGVDGTGGNGDYYGYIDDLRITKGVARYTTTFTPPTSQLQDQ